MKSVPKVIGVTGYKNSGKTTLVERLVEVFAGQGFKVSTIKHAHHAFDIDQKGRDSYRHRKAGAREVAVISRNQWAIIRDMHDEDEPALETVLAQLRPCDLVVVEGYKRDGHPKIEVRNLDLPHPPLDNLDGTIIAIAANRPVEDATLPVFGRDDINGISRFVSEKIGLRAP